jgi:hypothetical protein
MSDIIEGSQKKIEEQDTQSIILDDEPEAANTVESEDNEDGDEGGSPVKMKKHERTCPSTATHGPRCGVHFHKKRDHHVYKCMNEPWGRLHLHELDLPRQELMEKRFSTILSVGYHSLHLVISAFRSVKKDITIPLLFEEDRYPYTLIDFLLKNPVQFNYPCMTLCDMETLRKSLLKFFGIKKCFCKQGALSLSFENFEQSIDENHSKQLSSITKDANHESIKKLFNEFKIDLSYLK